VYIKNQTKCSLTQQFYYSLFSINEVLTCWKLLNGTFTRLTLQNYKCYCSQSFALLDITVMFFFTSILPNIHMHVFHFLQQENKQNCPRKKNWKRFSNHLFKVILLFAFFLVHIKGNFREKGNSMKKG